MSHRPPRLASLAAAAAASLALPSPAAANGVFPSADQIVFDPAAPGRAVLRTTYGLLTTTDSGATWDWICEGAVGYDDTGGLPPPIAATTGGRVLAALGNGLVASAEGGCAWAMAPELAGQAVLDISAQQGAPAHVVAVVGGLSNTLWRSLDGGQSWAQVGVPLPKEFQARTVDVAPSDPQRIYVSGPLSDDGAVKGHLARTIDGGQSWQLFPVAGSTATQDPYIGGIDPSDPEVVYVRLAGVPGRLLATRDGGLSWRQVYETQGFARAFAISPDGATVVVGSDVDGVWRAPSETLAFEKVSAIAPRCFAWTEGGLYACTTEFLDGFTVGRSLDAGETFEPLLRQACIRGPLECAAGTQSGDLCPAGWPRIALLTGHTDCTPDAGAPDGGGGATTASGGGADATGAGGGATAPPRGAPSAPGGGGGCGCWIGRGEAWSGAAAALAAAAFALGRRRRR